MAVDVIVPPLGTTVDTLTLVSWYKQEGDTVLKDEPLFVVETDKATLDVEAPASGILQRVSAQAGESVPCLSAIAIITSEGEAISEAKPLPPPTPAPAVALPKPPAPEPRREPQTRRIFISPRAKVLAEAHQVAWRAISGTGPEGAIVERDVVAELNRPRSTTIPITLTTETDATELVAFRERLQKMGVSVSCEDILLLILVRGLREYPRMNATLEGNTVTHWDAIHLGLTVEAEEDFRLAVLHDVGKMGLKALAQETAKMKETPVQSSGATFAVTNLGDFGIDAFTPLIAPPNCPLLGIGRIKPNYAKEGQRHSLWISLTFDPRLVGSTVGVRFLQHIAESIENPTLALI